MPKTTNPRRREVEAAVIDRVRHEMDRRDWQLSDLLVALDEAGHPVRHRTILKRLLEGERALTVDDAAGLAAAFEIDVATLIEPPTDRNSKLFALAVASGQYAERRVADAARELRLAERGLRQGVEDTAIFLRDSSRDSQGEATLGEIREKVLRQQLHALDNASSDDAPDLRAFIERVLEYAKETDEKGLDLEFSNATRDIGAFDIFRTEFPIGEETNLDD
ncbi:hypothetical protein [Rathayibacter sp. AY1C5]|uniref:hypothetical protein n=1 Tax=Rathayibacter sp. AY1C5 TaxID=2080538 RepID=UPI0015E370ED|nr:hypothetical protein [Rathayibacter sp. AY1C5]